MSASFRNRLFYRLALGLSIVLLLLLPASANESSPPQIVWIDFPDWSESIDTAQVLDCQERTCESPKVLAQFGQLDESTQDSSRVQLACQGKTCLMREDADQLGWTPDMLFQLRVRSGDRLWSSPTFSNPDVEQQAWKVFQGSDSLQIEFGEAFDRSLGPELHWGWGFILTLATEFLVLSFLLRWLGQPRRTWLRTYMNFGLMHLATYPLVWTLPIGLLPFQLKIERILGLGELLVSLVYLSFIYYARRAKAWTLISGSLFVLACSHFLVVLSALVLTFEQWERNMTGLNFGIAIAGTVLLITVFEAIVFYLLGQEKLSLKQTAAMSALMNGASLLMGILFWQVWV